MDPKSEYANKQQYRQIVATTTTNNHQRYTRNMQNITIVGGQFRMYPKAFEKAPISSSGSKQGLVDVRSVAQKL